MILSVLSMTCTSIASQIYAGFGFVIPEQKAKKKKTKRLTVSPYPLSPLKPKGGKETRNSQNLFIYLGFCSV